jgi:hypothetical protein
MSAFGAMAMEPVHLKVQAHAELGFPRQLKQPWQTSPNPTFGGSGGYDELFFMEQRTKISAVARNVGEQCGRGRQSGRAEGWTTP